MLLSVKKTSSGRVVCLMRDRDSRIKLHSGTSKNDVNNEARCIFCYLVMLFYEKSKKIRGYFTSD